MLQKLGFLPGFNKQVTSTGAESQWTGGCGGAAREGLRITMIGGSASTNRPGRRLDHADRLNSTVLTFFQPSEPVAACQSS